MTGGWPTPQAEQARQAGGVAGWTIDPEQEFNLLKAQADHLSRQLENIRKRIEKLENQ